MLPSIILTNTLTAFLNPRDKHYPLTISYESGGIDLYDASQGFIYVWKAWTDGSHIYCSNENKQYTLLSDSNITQIDITFDQNMYPCVAYVADGVSKLYWFDTQVNKHITTEYPTINYPRVSLDDKRKFNIGNSDIILAYQREDKLCCRIQRERYGIEHILATDSKKRILWHIGMGKSLRFLFYWR